MGWRDVALDRLTDLSGWQLSWLSMRYIIIALSVAALIDLAQAASHPDVHAALGFFPCKPDLRHATQLLLDRCDELDGDDWKLLVRASEMLSRRQPPAATLALRAMIEFTLNGRRSVDTAMQPNTWSPAPSRSP